MEIPDPVEEAEAIVRAAYHDHFRGLIREFNETWDAQHQVFTNETLDVLGLRELIRRFNEIRDREL